MNKLLIIFFTAIILFSFELSASKYDKENPSDLYEKATKQLKQEKYKAALNTLKKYTKAEKDDPDGWTLLAFTNRKLTNFSKAEELYEKALKLEPNNKIALEYQGELFVEINEMEKAITNLLKLENLCPNSCEEFEMLKNYIDGKDSKTLK
tara:strand:+ start:1773 stop:2225 length:453 start_codon:yes stop_codon:yes gene_type:complete